MQAGDWAQYHGAPPRRTTMGYTIAEGDKVLGLFGLVRDETRWILYLDIKPELRKDIQTLRVRRIVVQGIRKIRELMASLNTPIHSQAVTEYPRACEMLERIGMRHHDKGLYIWAR